MEPKLYKKLTKRQLEIADCARRGFTDGQIANAFNISINTVKTHLKYIYEKMEVSGRTELAGLPDWHEIRDTTSVPKNRTNALMDNRNGLNLSDSAGIDLLPTPQEACPASTAERARVVAISRLPSDDERAEVASLFNQAADIALSFVAPGTHRPRSLNSQTVAPIPTRIGREDIEQIEQVTAALRVLDYLHGGGASREAAAAQARRVTRLLDVYATDDIIQRLHLNLADLQNLAGWTSLDVGLYSPACSHFTNALVHARIAGDASLVANILYRTGRLYLHRSMTVEALRFFQLGLIVAQDSDCNLTVAVLCANKAMALAILGDREQAMVSLHRAGDAYARADRTKAAPWVRFFCEADLVATRGFIHLELADEDSAYLDTAHGFLEQSLALRGEEMARSRTFEQIGLATACLRNGDTDTGLAMGWKAIGAAERVQSARVRDRLHPLRIAAEAVPTSDASDLARYVASLTPA